MFYPHATFSDDTSSGFCFVSVDTHTHTYTHMYRADKPPSHAGDYVRVSNNTLEIVFRATHIRCVCVHVCAVLC